MEAILPFSPNSLGLSGERITALFGEDRNGCPHKGIDISSSRTSKPFSAGVFGIVGQPIGGQWGTVTVNPLHAPSVRIQYLHCTNISVASGQLVTPWTVLGSTGATAPPNSGITGIHLHLQVQPPGSGAPPCWKGRYFVDPTKFSTPDLMRGTWYREYTRVQGPLTVDYKETWSLPSSIVGQTGRVVLEAIAYSGSCRWHFIMDWRLPITGRRPDGSIDAQANAGSVNRPVSCGITGGWKPVSGQGRLALRSRDTMEILVGPSSGGMLQRIGNFATGSVDDEDQMTFVVTEEMEYLAKSAELTPIGVDPFATEAPTNAFATALDEVSLKDATPEATRAHFGVLDDEIF